MNLVGIPFTQGVPELFCLSFSKVSEDAVTAGAHSRTGQLSLGHCSREVEVGGAGAATSPSSNLLPCFGLPTIILLLCHTESHNKCQKQIFSTLGLSHHENKSLCQSLSSTLSYWLSISVITIHINSYNKNLIQEAYLFCSVHRLPRSRSSRPGVHIVCNLIFLEKISKNHFFKF